MGAATWQYRAPQEVEALIRRKSRCDCQCHKLARQVTGGNINCKRCGRAFCPRCKETVPGCEFKQHARECDELCG